MDKQPSCSTCKRVFKNHLTYSLKKFDMKKMNNKDFLVGIIGRRGCGSTTLVEDICFNIKDRISTTSVVCGKYGKIQYKDFVQDDFLYEEYNSESLLNIIKSQEEKKSYNSHAFICDELISDSNVLNGDENIKRLFYNGRCDRISSIIAMQNPLSIQPSLRNQFDYIFLFKENKSNERRKIYEQYAGMFPSFELFCKVFDYFTTTPFECLVIDNTVTSNNIEEQVFWYKANLHAPFKFGYQKKEIVNVSKNKDKDDEETFIIVEKANEIEN